jgi:hypothetical protein
MKKLIPLLLGKYINLMSVVAPSHAASLGFRMFCYPFRSPIKPYHKDFFGSAEQLTLQHNHLDIKVYRWNNGPKKILFLHGWQSHSFRWKNYLQSFSPEEYTLYAIDAPGHGLSSGRFLTVPLYSEVVEKFIHQYGPLDTIVSHSLGSFTTLYTLHRLPLLPVEKLVLLASPGNATEFLSFYRDSLKLSDRAIAAISDYFESVIGEPVEFFSAPTFAGTVTKRGLIIHDEDDDETSFSHSVNIHKAWPKAELMLTKGLTHNLKSPEIVEKVSSFIREARTEKSYALPNG